MLRRDIIFTCQGSWPEDDSRSLLNFKMFLINIAYRVVAYKNYVLNQSRLFQIFSNLELSN